MDGAGVGGEEGRKGLGSKEGERHRRMYGHKHRQQREKGNARGRIKEVKKLGIKKA